MKKHLTRQEEFEIMKLVLDKFLWVGTIILLFGFWQMISGNLGFWFGFTIFLSGAVLLVLFIMLLVKEFEYNKG